MNPYSFQCIFNPRGNGFILIMQLHEFFNEFRKSMFNNTLSDILHQTQLKRYIVNGQKATGNWFDTNDVMQIGSCIGFTCATITISLDWS